MLLDLDSDTFHRVLHFLTEGLLVDVKDGLTLAKSHDLSYPRFFVKTVRKGESKLRQAMRTLNAAALTSRECFMKVDWYSVCRVLREQLMVAKPGKLSIWLPNVLFQGDHSARLEPLRWHALACGALSLGPTKREYIRMCRPSRFHFGDEAEHYATASTWPSPTLGIPYMLMKNPYRPANKLPTTLGVLIGELLSGQALMEARKQVLRWELRAYRIGRRWDPHLHKWKRTTGLTTISDVRATFKQWQRSERHLQRTKERMWRAKKAAMKRGRKKM